jgi:hypothetical protein
MLNFRAYFLHHRRAAALLIALALCMKALIPAGYMLGGGVKTITVLICADSLGHQITKQIDVAHKDKGTAKADAPCAFTALTDGGLGGVDPIQLALGLLFILALALLPLLPAAQKRIRHIRPPLRGPPALA